MRAVEREGRWLESGVGGGRGGVPPPPEYVILLCGVLTPNEDYPSLRYYPAHYYSKFYTPPEEDKTLPLKFGCDAHFIPVCRYAQYPNDGYQASDPNDAEFHIGVVAHPSHICPVAAVWFTTTATTTTTANPAAMP